MTESAESRFWRKVDKNGPIPQRRPELGPCWIWLAGRQSKGYGQFKFQGKTVLAHRFSYQIAKGEIPEGMQPDHLCKNTSCIRPAHLEAVPALVNLMRSDALGAQNARKTHCKNGHELAGANLYINPRGERQCRVCRSRSSRAWRKQNRAYMNRWARLHPRGKSTNRKG
jgi:hypothetical protein